MITDSSCCPLLRSRGPSLQSSPAGVGALSLRDRVDGAQMVLEDHSKLLFHSSCYVQEEVESQKDRPLESAGEIRKHRFHPCVAKSSFWECGHTVTGLPKEGQGHGSFHACLSHPVPTWDVLPLCSTDKNPPQPSSFSGKGLFMYLLTSVYLFWV